MQFSLGKPIAVLAILALVSGAAVWHQTPPPRTDLLVWCIAPQHAQIYRDALPASGGGMTPPLIDQFQKKTGLSVRVDLLSGRAEEIRLVSLFMSQTRGQIVPDLCEIEISAIGKYLRAPIDDIGLLPLNGYLAHSPYAKSLLASRLAPYSRIDTRTGQRVYFGVPNDVHPMTISYRKDLFDEAGIDLEQAKTWPQFQEMCLRYQAYRAAHGHPNAHAMELYATNGELLVYLLLQQHLNLVDSSNQVHLTDSRVAETVAFYAQMVAGPRQIGIDIPQQGNQGASSLEDADVSAIFTPDWRASYLPKFEPRLAGQLRMMELPKFHPTDAPTTTWGGTMIGIPRACPHPDEAWKLIEFLYLSPQGNAARLAAGSNVLPPVSALWGDPVYHQVDLFYAGAKPGEKGQKVIELYAKLAQQLPDREVTPYTAQGQLALGQVLQYAEADLEANGPAHLQADCAKWLADAQTALQERIDFERFSP